MAKSSRSLFLFLFPLVVVLNLACEQGVYSDETSPNQPAAGDSAATHLEQAATSIIAAAKETLANADMSDEDAVRRAQLSLEAIRILGMLGDIDADSQSNKLLDAIADAGRPAVAAAVFQARFSNNLRRWPELEPTQRAKIIDGFVARFDLVQAEPLSEDLTRRSAPDRI